MSNALAVCDVCVLYGCDPGSTVEELSPGAVLVEANTPAELDEVARRHFTQANKRVALCFDSRVRDAEIETARAIMSEREHSANVGKNTIEAKTTESGRNVLRNLPRLSRHGFASSMGEPLKGRPAFIVGAGPSLDRNKHLLERARQKGAIIAVNTSSAAIPCEVDVVCSVESFDVSDHIRRNARRALYVLDMQAHPNTWDAAAECGAVAAAFPIDPPLNALALRLGCLPFTNGGAAACMAYSLAALWGASPIVLVGMDCSWAADGGKMYAGGTVYEGVSVKRDGDVIEASGENSGHIPRQHYKVVEAYGGDRTAITGRGMEDQIDWFADASRLIPTVNCTEGGARLGVARETTLAELLDELPDMPRRTLTPPGPVVGWREARDGLLAVARELAEGEHHLSEAQRKLPLIAMWILPLMLRLQSGPPNAPDAYHQAIMQGIRDGARDVVRTIEGGGLRVC